MSIKIACSTDDNFVQHCCVMLTSVLINNTDVDVYLFSEGLSSANLEIIKHEIIKHGGNLHFIVIDSYVIKNLPMPSFDNLKHISPATYYRLFITELLPSNIEKIIYLDCDIIVRKNLTDLWHTDVTGYALGAVYQMYDEVKNAIRLGYDLKYGYFNAGVLLINVNYWKKNKIPQKLLNFLNINKNQIIYHDQDALNAILHKHSLRLQCKWNMISFFFEKQVFTYVGNQNSKVLAEYHDYKKSLKKDILDPTIIHFVSRPKPWDKYCLHPFTKEYYKYAAKTINFKDITAPNFRIQRLLRIGDDWKKNIKYNAKQLLIKLGVLSTNQ